MQRPPRLFPDLDICHCGRESSGRGAAPCAPSPRTSNHPPAQRPGLQKGGEGMAPRAAIPGLLASPGRARCPLPRTGAGTGPGMLPGVVPPAREPAVGVSRGATMGGPGPRPVPGGPSCALTCAHAGSSRSSPAPALRPVAWAQASRCPAAGREARGGRLGARGGRLGARGRKAGGARGGPGHLQEPAAGAAGKAPQSGCERNQAPPGPLRPHVRPARAGCRDL